VRRNFSWPTLWACFTRVSGSWLFSVRGGAVHCRPKLQAVEGTLAQFVRYALICLKKDERVGLLVLGPIGSNHEPEAPLGKPSSLKCIGAISEH
jgi:hypothetical protein